MDDAKAMVTARQWIKHKPMPSSLDLEFKKNGWNDWLDKVYVRTAELVVENENVTKEVLRHLNCLWIRENDIFFVSLSCDNYNECNAYDTDNGC